MKIYKVLLLVITGLTFSTCIREDKRFLVFKPDPETNKEISLSDFADHILYVPIDNQIPLGHIYSYKLIETGIIISAKDAGILFYSSEGKFIRPIGSIGRGPGQYTFYSYFCIDENNRLVYVLDSRSVIKVFDLEGNFIRSFAAGEYGEIIDGLYCYGSNLVISYILRTPDTKYLFTIHDPEGRLIKAIERNDLLFSTNWLLSGGFFSYNNRVSYWNPFIDTVYTIQTDFSIKPSLIIDSGEGRFPRTKFYSFEEKLKYYCPLTILETDDYYFIRYFQINYNLTLLRKDNGEAYNISFNNEEEGIRNDIDGVVDFIPQYYHVDSDGEYLVSLVQSIQKMKRNINGIMRQTENPVIDQQEEFKTLLRNLNETDNPVLMKVMLKN